jgi:drug/metabolite transporter (DMT)-like permease
MNIAASLPIFFGLGAAILWGAADFAGGLGSRRASVYRVVLTGEWVGLLVLLPLPFIFHDPLPSWSEWLMSGLASVCGVVGITLLYRALAEGQMSVAAPVSGLLAAVIPMLYSAVTEGFPGFLKFCGFLLALVSIWLVSSAEGIGNTLKLRWAVLRLPILAALTFGAYFVLMHAATRQSTFWPLISARTAGVITLSVYILFTRQPWTPPRRAWLLAALCGVLDVSANAMYVLAGQAGRLDVAAVLGSLYPGMTVLLAWLLLKERLSRPQTVGVLLALIAIVLIAI